MTLISDDTFLIPVYDDSIEELLEKELSDDFKHLMIAVVQAARHEDDPVDENKAKEDAAALHEAGESID